MNFTFALVVGGFAIVAPLRPPEGDRWFAPDKAKHFVVSAVVQGVGHSVLRANGYEYREAAWTAGVVTATVGLTKEAWDLRRGGRFSWKDLVADAAGGGAGAVVVRQVGR